MKERAQDVRWHAVANAEALQQRAAERILQAASDSIRARNCFLVVLAGGQTPRGAYVLLRRAKADWAKWQVFFGDERCLPADDADRNSRMASDSWLDQVPIPKANVHLIPAELGAPAAEVYAETLRNVGEFDLVLLGLGEDGHTASLFPGRDWGVALDSPDVVAVADAPKPPSGRISLSAVRLSRARQVLFMVEGERKRGAVSDWRNGLDIPARAIRPANGVDVLVEDKLLSSKRAS